MQTQLSAGFRKTFEAADTPLAATVAIVSAPVSTGGETRFPVCLRLVRQPETGQRHAGEAGAEFFSAARRVTDWAMLLVSSSNLWCILFLSICFLPWGDDQAIQSPGDSAGSLGGEHDDFGDLSRATG